MHESLWKFFLKRRRHVFNFAEPSRDDAKLLLDAINVPPEEAIKLFEAKGYALTWSWRDMLRDAHTKAFTVAKVMKMDILKDIHDEVQKALKDGTTLKTFQENLEPILKTKGWWGKVLDKNVPADAGVSVPDEGKKVQLGSPWRLETIFRTNIQTSYMAGRYKEMKDVAAMRPYWQYLAILDQVTRPAHAAMNGLIYRHDDPFWNTFYPPNGFNCRCRVRSLNTTEIEKWGLKDKVRDSTLEGLPKDRNGNTVKPDEGWDYNPGEAGAKYLEALVEQRQAELNAPPAKTNPENEHLGVKIEGVNDEKLMSFIKEALEKAKDGKWALPKAVKFDEEFFKTHAKDDIDNTWAGYFTKTKTIYLNPLKEWENIAIIVQGEFDDNEWSSKSPLHFIFHEIGHHNHFMASPNKYKELYNSKMPDNAIRDLKDKISNRALLNPLEFVAEVAAAILAGRLKELDPVILFWYQEFKGGEGNAYDFSMRKV